MQKQVSGILLITALDLVLGRDGQFPWVLCALYSGRTGRQPVNANNMR